MPLTRRINNDGPPGFSITSDTSLASVADRFGVKTVSRNSVRVSIAFRHDLERWIQTTRRTGTFMVFFSQGTPAGCGWEE